MTNTQTIPSVSSPLDMTLVRKFDTAYRAACCDALRNDPPQLADYAAVVALVESIGVELLGSRELTVLVVESLIDGGGPCAGVVLALYVLADMELVELSPSVYDWIHTMWADARGE